MLSIILSFTKIHHTVDMLILADKTGVCNHQMRLMRGERLRGSTMNTQLPISEVLYMHLYRDKVLPGSENPSDKPLSLGGIVSCTLKRMQPTILDVLCMNACNSCDSNMRFFRADKRINSI